MARQKVAVGAGHRYSSKAAFFARKTSFKLFNDAF